MLDPKRFIWILALWLGACAARHKPPSGQPPPARPSVQAQAGQSAAGAVKDTGEQLAGQLELLQIASPAAGPALDRLPPIPSRPIERVPLDAKRVTRLSEGRQQPTTEVWRTMTNFPISFC